MTPACIWAFPGGSPSNWFIKTIEGSVAFARDSKRHPVDLRNMVTSPGGTSAEALYQLEKGGFRTVLSKAIWAAYQKSRYLGGLNNDG